MRKDLLSPAKINLGLTIVGRRENGLHCLESLFWPVSFGDLIEVAEGKGRVFLDWSKEAPYPNAPLPSESDNLVTKVLKSLEFFTNSFDYKISKNIPIGGGLGGGSSNVGTILKSLVDNHLLSKPNLSEWSAQFGADIPFFLFSYPAWVTGIGEEISTIELESDVTQKLHFLLVFFPFGCETKLIFQEFKKRKCLFSKSQKPFRQGRVTLPEIIKYLEVAKNDLEPIVSDLYPEVNTVIKKLRTRDCIYAGLSGSGSTCFAVFDSFEAREKTAKDLESFFRLNNCKSISAETFTTR